MLANWLFDSARALLDWLDGLPAGRQAIVATLFASAVIGLVGVLWTLSVRGWRRLVKLRQNKAEVRRTADAASAAAQSNRMGFAEALVAEEEALAKLPHFVEIAAKILREGVQRQEQIKRRMSAFSPHLPKARKQFNGFWVEHANNLRQVTRELRTQVDAFKGDARALRECQERLVEWNALTESQKPNEKWIAGYDTTVSSREMLRNLKQVIAPQAAEKRWDPKSRAMNRQFDNAVKGFVKVSGELTDVVADIEASCTVIINAVDQWRNDARASRLFPSGFRKRHEPKGN